MRNDMRAPLLSILALSLIVPAAANAADTATRSIAVSHADLNLANARDADVLAGRLERAALRACGASPASVREVRAETRASACYQDVMQQAVSQLPAPVISAMR
jgi:UrcA family protein